MIENVPPALTSASTLVVLLAPDRYAPANTEWQIALAVLNSPATITTALELLQIVLYLPAPIVLKQAPHITF